MGGEVEDTLLGLDAFIEYGGFENDYLERIQVCSRSRSIRGHLLDLICIFACGCDHLILDVADTARHLAVGDLLRRFAIGSCESFG